MTIQTFTICPNCDKSVEFDWSDKHIAIVALATQEGEVYECPYCRFVWGNFQYQEAAKGGDDKGTSIPGTSLTSYQPPRKSLCYICGKKTKFGSGYCKKHEPAKAVR